MKDFLEWMEVYEAAAPTQAPPGGVPAPPPGGGQMSQPQNKSTIARDMRNDITSMSGNAANAYAEVIAALQELSASPQGSSTVMRILSQLEMAVGREFTQLRTSLSQGARAVQQPQVQQPVA